MFAMFRQFFAMFAALFSAGSRLANAADHAAAFVEGEAAGFNERTTMERIQTMKKLRSKYTQEDYAMAAEEAAAKRSASDLIESVADNAAKRKSAKPAEQAA